MILGDKYIIEDNKLGAGTFSTVFSGKIIDTGQRVAIKKIDFSKKKIYYDKVKIEVSIMQNIDHPNIIKYIDIIKTETIWYIVMEYCNAGTLQDVINYHKEMQKEKSVTFIREANTYYYMNQLKKAMVYLRQNGLIHRDIKPANILITGCDETSDIVNYHHISKLTLKLADFGLAKNYGEEENNMTNTFCGSPLYMAPELLIDAKYGPKADLWSCGVIMYELLFGHLPTRASNVVQLKQILTSKDIDFHLTRTLSHECFDLLIQLLNKEQGKRIEWEKFFNHSWFNYWNNLEERERKIIMENMEKTGDKKYSSSIPIVKKDKTREIVDLDSIPMQNISSSEKAIPIPKRRIRGIGSSESISLPNMKRISGSNLTQFQSITKLNDTESLDSSIKSINSLNDNDNYDHLKYYAKSRSNSAVANAVDVYPTSLIKESHVTDPKPTGYLDVIMNYFTFKRN